ncbi:MAG: xylulokinase [Chloroflexi bacterium]|nr:xylulokinase [Chloroflexota bacterium]MCL5074777.1 xylulokinase [Chloroflexota bacterium]
MQYLLGIDLGTSTCKATLLSSDGQALSAECDPYSLHTPQDQWAEQNPDDWWGAVRQAVRRAIELAGCGERDVAAIGLSGQMHGLVLLDDDYRLLRPAILWCDHRSSQQCHHTLRQLPTIESITKNSLIPAFTLPKLLWVRDNEPSVYSRIRWVLLPKDYIRFRMTGELFSEPSDASGTAMFDVTNLTWSPEILKLLRIPLDWLPPCVSSTEITGLLMSAAGEDLGLVPGIPVVGGAGDQAAQAVAMGATVPAILGITIGTSGVIMMTQTSPVVGSFCHAISHRWLQLNSVYAAGLCLSWYRESFLPEVSYDDLVSLAIDAPPGSSGLIFLPFLLGGRESIGSSVPAGYTGLSVRHDRSHLVRALLEGVAFEFRRMLNAWIKQGMMVEEVRMSGGGSKSDLWRSIMANILNLPIERIDREASFGAALLAGVGVGWWKSVQDGYEANPSFGEREEPVLSLAEQYEGSYRRYVDFYELLAGGLGQLHGDPRHGR